MLINLRDVLAPKTMVRLANCRVTINIFNYGRYPYLYRTKSACAIVVGVHVYASILDSRPVQQNATYSCKSHTMYVIQFIDEPLPCPTAILLLLENTWR